MKKFMEVNWDNYIGTEYKTPKGGVLTVIDVFKNSRGATDCLCHCSICSLDNELWGGVDIVSSKCRLDSGTIPCGCAKNNVYTKEQNKIRVKRICLNRGYIFFGWKDNEYKGNKTYLLLGNPRTGNYWNTCTMNNFFRGKGDPEEKRQAISNMRKPADFYIKQLKDSGNFLVDTEFYQCEELYKSDYFNYTCPICSNDEYVKNNLCSGIFTGRFSNLMKGIKGCRCASSPRLTVEQKSFKLKSITDKEHLTFISFDGKRLQWLCENNHNNLTGYQEFLHGDRCRNCAILRQDWGLYKERINDNDTLYLLEFRDIIGGESFIKIGRSFDFKSRLRYFRRFYDVSVLSTLKEKHEYIFHKEKELHGIITEYSYFPIKDFKGRYYECFNLHALNHPEIISTFNLEPT